jgi:hypothetical protein
MNSNLFGRNRRIAGAAAVTAALLVPLGVFGAPALAGSTGASSAQYQYKVTICHHTHSKKHPMHTITVSNKSVAKHLLKQGDTLGPCPAAAPTSSSTTHGNGKGKNNTPPGQSTVQPGQSGDQHGKSGESHGNGKNK